MLFSSLIVVYVLFKVCVQTGTFVTCVIYLFDIQICVSVIILRIQVNIGSREDGSSTDTMKKTKPTKVPVMKEDQPYRDWRKEVEIWQAHNTGLGVAPRLQAGALFQSLQGMPRQIVLSELSVAELTADDGVTNIVNTLDVFFYGK